MPIIDDTSPSWAATPSGAGSGAFDGALDYKTSDQKSFVVQYATPGTVSTSDGMGPASQSGNGGFSGSLG